MLKINQRGLDLIKLFEGCKLEAYLCPAKVVTIGYGSTGRHVRMGMRITQSEADKLLADDLRPREAALRELIGDAPTTSDQFSAMLSLLYNVGAANFKGSTVLRKHKAGDIAGASDAFLAWNKARVRGKLTILPGLTRRRAAERRLYRGEP